MCKQYSSLITFFFLRRTKNVISFTIKKIYFFFLLFTLDSFFLAIQKLNNKNLKFLFFCCKDGGCYCMSSLYLNRNQVSSSSKNKFGYETVFFCMVNVALRFVRLFIEFSLDRTPPCVHNARTSQLRLERI